MQNANRGPRPGLTSVEKALRVLTLLRERGSLRVAETARELGIARSNAHRMLATMQTHGYTAQDPATKAYGPGPALLELAVWARDATGLGGRIRPAMEALGARLGETINLVVLKGTDIVFVDCIESERPVRVGSRLGQAMAAHCTSGGKVLLAELSRDDLHRLYPSATLPALTPASITSRDELEAELDRVRRDGYAVNQGESESDVFAAAVALASAAGGALTVSTPLSRVDPAYAAEIATQLLAAARAVSRDVR